MGNDFVKKVSRVSTIAGSSSCSKQPSSPQLNVDVYASDWGALLALGLFHLTPRYKHLLLSTVTVLRAPRRAARGNSKRARFSQAFVNVSNSHNQR